MIEMVEENITYTKSGVFTYQMKIKREFLEFPTPLTEQTENELPSHIIILEIDFDMQVKLIITIPRNKILLKQAEEMRDRMLRYVLENYPRVRGTERESEIKFIDELIMVSIAAHRAFYKK